MVPRGQVQLDNEKSAKVQNDFEIAQSDAFAAPGFHLACETSVQPRNPGSIEPPPTDLSCHPEPKRRICLRNNDLDDLPEFFREVLVFD